MLVEELNEVDPLLLVVCLPSNLACGRLCSIAWALAWVSAQRERCVVSAADPCFDVLASVASPVLDFLFAPHAVIVSGQVVEENYPYFLGFAHLASGLSNGLSGLAAGICIGIVGDAGVRATGQNVCYSELDCLCALCWLEFGPTPTFARHGVVPSCCSVLSMDVQGALAFSVQGALACSDLILTLMPSAGVCCFFASAFVFLLFSSAQPKLYVIMILILIFAEAYVALHLPARLWLVYCSGRAGVQRAGAIRSGSTKVASLGADSDYSVLLHRS